jgi:sugar/nucleoside kinase (ribokinase family)
MSKLSIYGSARVDAFLEVPSDKAGQHCKLDTKDCFIELSYASKISLNGVKFLVGGNGANVAIGTKRLGIDCTLAAELGEGPLSDYAKKVLETEIDGKFLSQTPGVDQGFGAVIVYQGERTILSYYAPFEPPFPQDSCSSSWVYLTSSGETFETYFEKIYEALLKCKPKLAFNPGGRQIQKGIPWLKKYLEKTELLLVNREEAEEILEKRFDHGSEKEILKEILQTGVKNAVVTDGSGGSFATDGKGFYKTGILPIDAIERTGAGDAFSSGCLSALIKGKGLKEGLLWGTVNSASVVGFVGPQEGLLAESEISAWLKRAKSSGVEVVEF